METICGQCHALVGLKEPGLNCPACGGELRERAEIADEQPLPGPPVETDHRGIVLPRRHALGGVITPQ